MPLPQVVRRVAPILAITVAAAAPSFGQTPAPEPRPSAAPAARAVDPAGKYDWSFGTSDFTVNGTLTVTKKDSSFAGVFTSDQTPGEMAAKSVTFDGKRLTATVAGDFGEFVAMIDMDDSGVTGTYKLTQADGSVNTGALSVKKEGK